MLFAPAELNPFFWWQIQYEKMSQKQKEESEKYWQERYNEWLLESAKPELLKAYNRYRELLNEIGVPPQEPWWIKKS